MDLVSVREAVAVGIGFARIGAERGFLGVRESVAVGIDGCENVDDDGRRRRIALEAAVAHDELDDVEADDVGNEGCLGRRGVGERSDAVRGSRDQRPAIAERRAVGIRRGAAVELHGVARVRRAGRARVGARARIVGVDHDLVGRARAHAVVGDEPHAVATRAIDREARIDGARIREHGAAARRRRDDLPVVGERVAVRVGRRRAVEHRHAADGDRLIGAGRRARRGVARRDRHRIRCARCLPVAHDELEDVVAREIGDEGRPYCGRVG